MGLVTAVICSLTQSFDSVNAQTIEAGVLESIDFEEWNRTWVMRIHFTTPMRYLRHSPSNQGNVVRVHLSPLTLDSRDEPLRIGSDSLPAPAGSPVPVQGVVYQPGPGRSHLEIRFLRPVRFVFRPDGDSTSLSIVILEVIEPSVHSEPEVPPEEGTAALASPDLDQIEEMMSAAHEAMTARETDRAIAIFTKVLSFPENEHSASAMEWLGLARERNGQLAHAHAEYLDYLERYPAGEGAERVRQRLATLTSMRSAPIETLRKRAPEYQPLDLETFGTLYTSYRRAVRHVDELGAITTDSSFYTDVYTQMRLRTENYTVQGVLSGGYNYDFTDGGGSTTRISRMFVEAVDPARGLSASIGRQSRGTAGVLGRHDGIHLGARLGDHWELGAVGGFLVDSSDLAFDTDKYFVGVSLDASQIAESVDLQIYAIHQVADGSTDRTAVGGEFRFFQDGQFVGGLIEYDIYFLSLNAVQLRGNFQANPSTFLNALVDYRNAPTITTSNALLGLPTSFLEDPENDLSSSALKSLAEDRTAKLLTINLGASHDLTDRFQLAGDFSVTNLDGIAAVGDQAPIEGTGYEFSYFAQLIANDLARPGAVGVLGLRYFDGSLADLVAATLDGRIPVTDRLMGKARLMGSYRMNQGTSDVFSLIPSIRLEYRLGDFTLDGLAGIDWMLPTGSASGSDEWGYFLNFAVRYDF